MVPLITDAQFNSIALVVVSVITIIPATLAAFWSRSAKKSSAEAAREVSTNGSMDDPNPNINDHIKYQTEMLEKMSERQDDTERLLVDHISHSKLIHSAVAELWFKVMPHHRSLTDLEDQGGSGD